MCVICIYVYLYISGHKWSTTHRALKSHRCKMGVIYIQSWKQCALPVMTTMALWQLMPLGTWCAQENDLPQSLCGDNRGVTLFSWMHIYIYIYIYHKNCVTKLQQSAQLVERFISNEWWKTLVYNLKFHACCNHQVYILILIS